MKTQKLLFSTLYVASIMCAMLMVLWFVGVTLYLVDTGATYSYEFQAEDGSFGMACGVPIFTSENWLWRSFELFGVPTFVLLASLQTARSLHKRFV